MGFSYKNFINGLRIVQKTVSSNSIVGDLEVLADNNLYYFDGTTNSPILTAFGSATVINKLLEDSTVKFFNNVDPTKLVRFDLSGITTGTTQVLTVPNFTDTLAVLAGAQAFTNKTIDASLNTITNIVNANIGASAAIDYSKLNLTGSIVNADISASAAISRAKIAAGTPNHVVINDGTGLLSSEATLSPVRGGTGIANNAASTLTISGNFATTLTVSAITSLTLPVTGTLATLAGTEFFSNKTFLDAITNAQIATPANPSAGFNKLYFKSDNNLYSLTPAGVETQFGTTTSAEPRGNFIINSNLDFWQRGTTFSFAGASGSGYTSDRWQLKYSGLVGSFGIQVTQTTDTLDGSKFQLSFTKTTGSATAGNIEFYQTLENTDSLALYNQTASFSVKVKANNLVNQVGIQFYYNTTESSVSTPIGSEVTATINNSTYTTITISGQALGTAMTSSGVIGVRIRPTGASSGDVLALNNGIRIAQAIINKGSTAAEYQRQNKSIAEELVACQRYYEKSYDDNVNPATITDVGSIRFLPASTGAIFFPTNPFKVSKRINSGTVTIYSPVTGTSGKVRNLSTAVDVTASAVNLGKNAYTVSTTLTNAQIFSYHSVYDAEIT